MRELLEETGYETKELISLGDFVEVPDISTSKCFVFIAKVGEKNSQLLEPGENWIPIVLTSDEINSYQLSGKIIDASTLAALRIWSLSQKLSK